MKNTFIPEGYSITREQIARLITTELQEVHQLDVDDIEPNDPRLTDKLCQEIANDWYGEQNPDPVIGDLWESEDDISEKWSQRILDIFNSDNKPNIPLKVMVKEYLPIIASLYSVPSEQLLPGTLIHILSLLLKCSLEEAESFINDIVSISEDDPEAMPEDWISEYLLQDDNHQTL